MQKPKNDKAVRLCCLAAFLLIAAVAAVDIVRYALLGSAIPLVVQCLTEAVLVLAALLAWQARLPALLLAPAAVALAVGIQTNYLETTLFNFGFFLQAGAAVLGAAAGSWFQCRAGAAPRRPRAWTALLLGVLVIGGLTVWQANTVAARSADSPAPSIWAVPERYVQPAAEGGTIEELTYTTQAYAATADDAGFRASRDHRAFAGLSRGAVTTYHSVICSSLDHFS